MEDDVSDLRRKPEELASVVVQFHGDDSGGSVLDSISVLPSLLSSTKRQLTDEGVCSDHHKVSENTTSFSFCISYECWGLSD